VGDVEKACARKMAMCSSILMVLHMDVQQHLDGAAHGLLCKRPCVAMCKRRGGPAHHYYTWPFPHKRDVEKAMHSTIFHGSSGLNHLCKKNQISQNKLTFHCTVRQKSKGKKK